MKGVSTIFAYAPGVSTGWVLGVVDGDDVEIVEYDQFTAPSHTDTAFTLKGAIWCYKPDVVVGERFDLRPHNQFLADLTPVKVNAIMDYIYDKRPIVYQTPTQAKTLVRDATLKALGFWPTGKSVDQPDADDVRDAARHLYHYCAMTLGLRGLLERMSR